MEKMIKKFITLTVIVSFLTKSTVTNYLPAGALAKEETLRPVAAKIIERKNREIQNASGFLKTTSAGGKDSILRHQYDKISQQSIVGLSYQRRVSATAKQLFIKTKSALFQQWFTVGKIPILQRISKKAYQRLTEIFAKDQYSRSLFNKLLQEVGNCRISFVPNKEKPSIAAEATGYYSCFRKSFYTNGCNSINIFIPVANAHNASQTISSIRETLLKAAVIVELCKESHWTPQEITQLEDLGYLDYEMLRRLLRHTLSIESADETPVLVWKRLITKSKQLRENLIALERLLSGGEYPCRKAHLRRVLHEMKKLKDAEGISSDTATLIEFIVNDFETKPWLSDFFRLIGADTSYIRRQIDKNISLESLQIPHTIPESKKRVFETLFRSEIPDDYRSYELWIKNGQPYCIVWDGVEQYWRSGKGHDSYNSPVVKILPLFLRWQGRDSKTLECEVKRRYPAFKGKKIKILEGFKIWSVENSGPILYCPGTLVSGDKVFDRAIEEIDSYFDKNLICLDMGCGGGLASIYWAHKGGKCVASDINPLAVEFLRYNSIALGLESQIDVRGPAYLFDAVYNERYPLIFFVPPLNPDRLGMRFFTGQTAQPGFLQTNMWDWYGAVLQRFCSQFNDYLVANGKCIIIHPKSQEIADLFKRDGLKISSSYYSLLVEKRGQELSASLPAIKKPLGVPVSHIDSAA